MVSNTQTTPPTGAPQVAIVITNWNGRRFLQPCLDSILAQDFQDFEIYVVDNASTDDSVALLREHYPQVQVLENERNVGLCAANNRGILAAQAEFIFILNNDTELEPDCLGQLVQALRTNPRLGMAATKMLLTDRRDMIESAGIVVDKTGIAWGLQTGALNQNRAAAGVAPVFGACGGAALYRRAMLLEIGLFDEEFFVYLEDADVAWRGQWAGWQGVVAPGAVVYHAHSATIKEGSPFKIRLLGRNKLWLIAKNYPLPYLLWYAPAIVAYEALAVGYNLLSGRGRAALQGRFEALRRLPEILAKRRRVVRNIPVGEMMARLHPAANPLFLWRQYVNIAGSVRSKHTHR
jgi:hypothetical protein